MNDDHEKKMPDESPAKPDEGKPTQPEKPIVVPDDAEWHELAMEPPPVENVAKPKPSPPPPPPAPSKGDSESKPTVESGGEDESSE